VILKSLSYTLAIATSLWSLGQPIALAFSDTQSHWGNTCINQLSQQNLVSGYPDRTFRPQATVTRAEFAVLMLNTFRNRPATRSAISFNDVPTNHWAHRAIRDAYMSEFFSGYPDGNFRPNQPIPRVQAIAIVSNASYMSAPANPDATLRQYFDDAQQVPAYARRSIAAGTAGRLIVNYPNVRQLRPNQAITRGEAAVLLCQSLNLARTVPLENVAGDRNAFAIPPEMGGESSFSEGLAVVKLNGKYGYMDTQGRVVIPARFDQARSFSEGLALVQVNGTWSFIDRTGNQVITAPPSTVEIAPFSDGLARFTNEASETGFIDKNGQVVIAPQPRYIGSFSEGLATIAVDSKIGFIDKTGAIVIAPQFEATRDFSDGLAAVKVRLSDTQSRWGFIDRSGNMVIEPQFYEVQQFSEGLAPVNVSGGNVSGGWGYIDRSGAIVIPGQFRAPEDADRLPALPFRDGLAMVRVGERAGYIDRTGRWVIEPRFTDADSVSGGFARVNLSGTWVREEVGYTQNGGPDIALRHRGGRWGYIRVPSSAQTP